MTIRGLMLPKTRSRAESCDDPRELEEAKFINWRKVAGVEFVRGGFTRHSRQRWVQSASARNRRDEENAIAQRYQVTGLPTTVFITRDARIAQKWTGAMSEKQLLAFVEALAR